MVCEVLLRVRPIPEGAVEPRGAAFRLRLTSPVHKEPRCPLVCLQRRPSETKKTWQGSKGSLPKAFLFLLEKMQFQTPPNRRSGDAGRATATGNECRSLLVNHRFFFFFLFKVKCRSYLLAVFTEQLLRCPLSERGSQCNWS